MKRENVGRGGLALQSDVQKLSRKTIQIERAIKEFLYTLSESHVAYYTSWKHSF